MKSDMDGMISCLWTKSGKNKIERFLPLLNIFERL